MALRADKQGDHRGAFDKNRTFLGLNQIHFTISGSLSDGIWNA